MLLDTQFILYACPFRDLLVQLVHKEIQVHLVKLALKDKVVVKGNQVRREIQVLRDNRGIRVTKETLV